jgi:hypothetical protein
LGQLQVAFWVVTMAVIAFYVAGLVMSVFNPLELWIFTAAVIALLVLLVLHERRVLRVLRDEDAPGHDELRRRLNRHRETRGF